MSMSLSLASFYRCLMSRSCCRFIAHRSSGVTLHLGGNKNRNDYYNNNHNDDNTNLNLKFNRFLATQQHRQHDGLHVEHKKSQPKQTYEGASCGGNTWSRKLIPGVAFGAGVLAVAGYMWFVKYKEGQPPDILTLTLKMGILASKKDDFEKAQHLFNKVLELAHQQHDEKLIDDKELLLLQIKILGLMATDAEITGDCVNVERLYKDTIQKWIAAGRAQDDDFIVKLSIELSSLYATMSRDDEAEAGFKFCVETMDEKVKAIGGVLESATYTLELWDQSVERYDRFLMKMKKYSQSIELRKQSLVVARKVYGADHRQALFALRSLAWTYRINDQYKEARETHEELVSRNERLEDGRLLVLDYCRLAEDCIETKDFAAAKSNCIKCLEMAKKMDYPAQYKAAGSKYPAELKAADIKLGERCLGNVQRMQAIEEDKKT